MPTEVGIRGVVVVESSRQPDDKITTDKRYFISPLTPNAKRCAQTIRSHWETENRLHWCQDMTFGEGACRRRTNHAPPNLNIVRKITMNLPRLNPLNH
jgi:predicted transposase YbfD/YdcC